MTSQGRAKRPFDLQGTVFTKYLWPSYAIIFFLIGTALTFSLWYVYHQLKASAFAETHSLAVALDELNRRQLEAMAIPLESVVNNINEKGGLGQFQGNELDLLFERTQKSMATGRVRSFFAINREGQFVGSSYGSHLQTEKLSFKGDPEFDYIRTQKSHTVLSSAVSHLDQQRLIILMKTLYNREGRFDGIIGTTKETEQFENVYKSLNLPYGVSFTMFRDDGKILYRYPTDKNLEGQTVSLSGKVLGDSEGYLDSSPRIGELKEKLGYYKFASEFGGMIYVGYNTEELFKNWSLFCKFSATLFLTCMGALAIIVRLAQRRQFSLDKSQQEHEHRDQLVHTIQEATETLTGRDYLQELSLQIARTFEVSNVAIGVLMPEHNDAVKFIVNWVGGQWGTEYLYDLHNTPFEKLKPGEFFACAQRAHEVFAKDPLLGDPRVESCMGMGLQDSSGRRIGIVLVYGDAELEELDFKRVVLGVFGARAGAELERIRTDEIRKEVEKLRRQIEERSLQSEKLEAMGTLAEGIAHDFNNILAIVLASTEKMMNLHADADQDVHYLQSIKRACHRARHLIAQILSFNQKDETEIQVVMMKEVFGDTMEFLRSTLPAQIRLVLDMNGCADLVFNADRNQIQQALLNLCINAARYIGPQAGEIKINLKQVQIKERTFVKWMIHSTGEEIERDEVEKGFDPMYAQNLSLLVVQRIVTTHQGFVEVKSESGQGTTFEVFLPVLSGPRKELTSKTPGKTTQYNFKSASRVMIVDDEPEIGSLIKELLEIEGLKVDTFSDPILALKTFLEKQQMYFMIISDLSMPGMSGIEFARKVRVLNQHVSFVLWSGYHHLLDHELQDLNVKVLSKPVDVQKLLLLIQAELSQQLYPNISTEYRGPDTLPSAHP